MSQRTHEHVGNTFLYEVILNACYLVAPVFNFAFKLLLGGQLALSKVLTFYGSLYLNDHPSIDLQGRARVSLGWVTTVLPFMH